MTNTRFLVTAKRLDTGEKVTGYYAYHEPPLQCLQSDKTEPGKHLIIKTGFADWNMPRPLDCYPIDPETLELVSVSVANIRDNIDPPQLRKVDGPERIGDCPNCGITVYKEQYNSKLISLM